MRAGMLVGALAAGAAAAAVVGRGVRNRRGAVPTEAAPPARASGDGHAPSPHAVPGRGAGTAEAVAPGRAPSPGPPDAAHVADPRRWIALGVVLTASFMVLLDISIVNVAIPSIQNTLHATFAEVQLVLALYSLGYAVVLITGGRLGDVYGRKRLFMIGMAGFVLASALCGFAQTPTMLVTSRLFQGVMAALMYPQVLSVIQVSFPPRERATAFAVFGAVIGLATIMGPLVGGLLIQGDVLGLTWRPIFLVNVPIGVAALVAAWVLLRESFAPIARRLDLPGVALVTVALLLLVWPLVEGREAGWPAWAFASLIASAPVFAVFLLFERRKSRRPGSSPLVDLALAKDRGFAPGLVVAFVFFAGIPSFFLVFSLTLQIGLGYSPLHAGLTTIPFSVGSFLASIASSRLALRLGRRILFVGSGTVIAGLLLLILTVHLAGASITELQLIPSLLVSGLGLGCVVAPLINVVLATIAPRNAGSASGVLTTVQQVGAAVGVAVVGVIFFGLLSNHASSVGRDLAPSVASRLSAAGVPQGRIPTLVVQFQRCFDARSASSDPSVAPPSCPAPRAGSPVSAVLSAAGQEARARDFTDSFAVSLLFNIALFATTFTAIAFLPRAAPSQMPRPAAAAAAR